MSASPAPIAANLPTKSSVGIHIFYLVGIALLALAAHQWLQEHDARMQIAGDLKVSQKTEATLQEQIKSLHDASTKQATQVRTIVKTIKTPAQAIAAMPSLEPLPLHERAIPSMPSQVAVDAVALAQTLGECKAEAIELGSCKKELALQGDVHAEDQKQIALLKKKPSFFHRLMGTVKNDGIFIVVGILLKVVAK